VSTVPVEIVRLLVLFVNMAYSITYLSIVCSEKRYRYLHIRHAVEIVGLYTARCMLSHASSTQ